MIRITTRPLVFITVKTIGTETIIHIIAAQISMLNAWQQENPVIAANCE